MVAEKQKSRVCLFDNLKFLLILTVVVGHFADWVSGTSHLYKSIFIFIYAFHMPLFLFCSGIFHKNKDITLKIVKFICAGFACKFLISFTDLIFKGEMKFTLLGDNGIPWYMFVLAIYVFVTYALRNIDKRYLLVFSILLACFVGYDSSVGDYLYISRAVVFYPFYLCGTMLTKESIMKINSSKLMKIAGIGILVLWAILCFMKTDLMTELRPLFTGRNPFSSSEIFEKWGFFYRALCILITFVTGFALLILVPNRKLPFITAYGSRTLQVYFWHYPFVLLLKKLGVDTLLMQSSAGKIGWLVIGVVLTFILSTRLFSFPMKQVFDLCRCKVLCDKK